MSPGTMYDKQALTYAVNEHYLNLWAAKIEVACSNSNGKPIGDMVEAPVETYWQAKTEREDVARARYRSAVELDDEALVASVASRTESATLDIFASAPDALDIELANRVLVTSISVQYGACSSSAVPAL